MKRAAKAAPLILFWAEPLTSWRLKKQASGPGMSAARGKSKLAVAGALLLAKQETSGLDAHAIVQVAGDRTLLLSGPVSLAALALAAEADFLAVGSLPSLMAGGERPSIISGATDAITKAPNPIERRHKAPRTISATPPRLIFDRA